MPNGRQLLLIVAVGLGIAMSVQVLQGAFDNGDRRKAVEIVRRMHGAGNRSIDEVIAMRHGAAVPSLLWTARIVNGCWGRIDAHCYVPGSAGGPKGLADSGRSTMGAEYIFAVDVIRGRVAPVNEGARLVLLQIGAFKDGGGS